MPEQSDQPIDNKPLAKSSVRIRLFRALLVATVVVVGWLLFHCFSYRCWFFINGAEYVVTQSATLFIWLLTFCVVRVRGKALLVAVTLACLIAAGSIERQPISAAQSFAA